MLDFTHLQNLLGGDADMAHRFLAAFRQEIPNQLDAMRQSLRTGDLAQVNLLAHTLKGPLNYLNATELASLAWQTEQLTEAGGEVSKLESLIAELTAGVEKLLATP